jgi:enterochelin esterase-like enzyme
MGPPEARGVYSLFLGASAPALRGPPAMALSLVCGKQDFFRFENLEAHKDLLKAGVPHQWIYMDGDHHRDFWSSHVMSQLDYFARHAARSRVPAEQ